MQVVNVLTNVSKVRCFTDNGKIQAPDKSVNAILFTPESCLKACIKNKTQLHIFAVVKLENAAVITFGNGNSVPSPFCPNSQHCYTLIRWVAGERVYV